MIIEKYFVKIVSYVDSDDVYNVTATVIDTPIIKKIRIKNAVIESDGLIEVLSVFGTQWHECSDIDRPAFNRFDLAISAYLDSIKNSCNPLNLMSHMLDQGFLSH